MSELSTHHFEDRFQRLADHLEHDELRALLDRLVAHELNAGETLITAGTDTDALFLVWDGSLEVALPGSPDAVVVGRGDYLGEITLLSPGPATATGQAVEPTTVLSFTPQALEELAQLHPQAAAGLLTELVHTIARRVKRTARVVAQMELAAVLPELAEPTDAASALGELRGDSGDLVGALAGIAAPRSLAAGEVVGRAGTRSDTLHLVLRGALHRRLPERGDRGGPAEVLTLGAVAGRRRGARRHGPGRRPDRRRPDRGGGAGRAGAARGCPRRRRTGRCTGWRDVSSPPSCARCWARCTPRPR